MNVNQNTAPYLITSRDFPAEDPNILSQVLSRTYLDVANAVNARTISIYPINRFIVTGETWRLSGNIKYQSMRQVFQFTSTSAIPTNINLLNFGGFTHMYGTYTDGTNWYPLLGSSTTPIAGQISFYVAANGSITFVSGSSPPSVNSGFVILEWLTAT